MCFHCTLMSSHLRRLKYFFLSLSLLFFKLLFYFQILIQISSAQNHTQEIKTSNILYKVRTDSLLEFSLHIYRTRMVKGGIILQGDL